MKDWVVNVVDDDVVERIMAMGATLGKCVARDVILEAYDEARRLRINGCSDPASEMASREPRYERWLADAVADMAERFSREEVEELLYFTLGPCYESPIALAHKFAECVYAYCSCDTALLWHKFRATIAFWLLRAGVTDIVTRVSGEAVFIVMAGRDDLVIYANAADRAIFVRCIEPGHVIVDDRIRDAEEFIAWEKECDERWDFIKNLFTQITFAELWNIALCAKKYLRRFHAPYP